MSESSHKPLLPDQLRALAESLRKANAAPLNNGHNLSMDALSVLFKLGSSPDSAADCLKMLHEFQIHQIELELQHEQNTANLHEMEADLTRYKQLYEFAPVGYLSINSEGRITGSNLAGAALLGIDSQELDGESLETFLAHSSRPLLNWQLKKLFSGSPGETCTLQTLDSSDDANLLRSFTSLAPSGKEVFLILTKAE